MNLKKLGIIIQREYLNKVKKKSFLLTTPLSAFRSCSPACTP